MITETPSVTHLSQVIAQAVAPAFILGALAALISVLVARLNRISVCLPPVIVLGLLDEIAANPEAMAALKAEDYERFERV